MRVYARFVGDGIAYDITVRGEIDDLHDAHKVARGPDPWVFAELRYPDGSRQHLRVNLAQAYRLEASPIERPVVGREAPF